MEQETGTVDENIRLFVPGLEHQAGCFRISDDDLAHDSQGKDNEDAGNRDCMIQNAENENVGAGAHLSCAKSGDESVEINVLDAPKGDLQFSGGSAEFFLKKRNTEDEGQDTEEDEDGRPRTWSNDSGPIRRTLRTIDKYVSPGVDTMIDRASSVLETSTTFFVGRGDEGNDSENSGGDEDASMVDKLRAENAELRANTTVVTNERDEMKKLNHALKLTLDDLTKAHEENRSRLAKLDDLERRIRVVENENEHLGSINDKLQQSMREMHDEAVVLEAEASKVTQMNRDEEELKQKIEELEKQNTDARVFAETSQQQNSALQEEINRVKQANKATTWDFESKIKDLESQVFEMSSENRRLTEDKDELESKLKIQTEKGSTQAELTQKLLKSEQQNVATLEQKLENALSQLSLLESSSNDVQVQLRTEISKLESQNSDYEAQISRMRETFGAEDAEKSKTVEQLRGEIVGLQEQNQLLELSKLKSDRNAKNIEANVLALDTKLTQSTAVQDELSGTVRHLQDQIEQHRKEQLDWEQTERDLEKKVSRLQEQIFRQTDDNSKEFGREQSLVDENASLTHETSELKLSVNTLEQRCSGQQLEISQLNAALLEMRSQRDAARDERKDLVELSSQIDSLKHESEQNRILKETNKDLSEQLITMTKLHQESVRAGGAYTEQLEEVQADYVRDTERLIETVRKHEGTISNLNSDIAKLKVHVEEIELRERKTLKSEQASQEQCDILRQQLESVQRELDETISGLKHEATLLEGVTKAEETLHARILQLESDLKAQKTTTDTLREEVRLKDEAIYSLKKKNAAVESKYESETVSLRDEVSQGNVQLARETQKLETALKQAKALGNDQEQEYKRTIAALEKRIARLNIELEEKGIEARKLKARQWDVQSDNTNSCDLQHKVKQTLREKDMLYLELTNLKNKLKSEVAKVKTECQHDFDRKLCQVESSYEQAEAELQYRLQQLEQKSKADSESSTKLRVRNIELEHEIRHLLSNRNYPVEGKSSQKQVTVDDSARAKRLFDQLRKMTENTLKLEQMHALEIERLHAQLQKERGWYTNLISSEREENQTLRTNISKKAKSPPVPPVLDKPGNSKHLAGFLALLLMHLGRVDRGKQVAVAFAKLRQYSPALEVAEPVSLLRPLTPKRTMLFRYKYLVNCIIRWKRSRDRNYLDLYSSTDAMKECRIVVGCRVRPLNKHELSLGNTNSWACCGDSNTITQEKGIQARKEAAQHKYDYVFHENHDNNHVYENLGRPIISAVLDGFHGTVFAYGQTSSGKTHTLLGVPEEMGIIVHSVHDIFDYIHRAPQEMEFLVRVSYLEIYNEEIKDLLSNKKESESLKVSEDPGKGCQVKGLKEVVVLSPDHVFELLKSGEEKRHYGSTRMNYTSSRSHTLFRLAVESRVESVRKEGGDEVVEHKDDGSGGPSQIVQVSTLNLVDLAGSERVAKTEATGTRLKEGASINKSLLVLGTVINKLAEGKKGHIPFRDSKLTRLLSNSLGGNAKTAVICTLSPAERNIEETKSTLQFASRAKTIVNQAKKNQVMDKSALLDQYRTEIAELKLKLASGGSVVDMPQLDQMRMQLKEEESKRMELEKKYEYEHEKHEKERATLEEMRKLVLLTSKVAANPEFTLEIQEKIKSVANGDRSAKHVRVEVEKMVQDEDITVGDTSDQLGEISRNKVNNVFKFKSTRRLSTLCQGIVKTMAEQRNQEQRTMSETIWKENNKRLFSENSELRLQLQEVHRNTTERRLEAAHEENERLLHELEMGKLEIKRLNNEVQLLTGAKETAEESMVTLSGEVENYRVQLDAATQGVTLAQKRVSELDIGVKGNSEEIESLLKTKDDEITLLQQRLAAVDNKQVEELKDKLEQALDDIKALSTEREILKTLHVDTVRKHEAQLEELLERMQVQEGKAGKRVMEQGAELKELHERVQYFESKVSQLGSASSLTQTTKTIQSIFETFMSTCERTIGERIHHKVGLVEQRLESLEETAQRIPQLGKSAQGTTPLGEPSAPNTGSLNTPVMNNIPVGGSPSAQFAINTRTTVQSRRREACLMRELQDASNRLQEMETTLSLVSSKGRYCNELLGELDAATIANEALLQKLSRVESTAEQLKQERDSLQYRIVELESELDRYENDHTSKQVADQIIRDLQLRLEHCEVSMRESEKARCIIESRLQEEESQRMSLEQALRAAQEEAEQATETFLKYQKKAEARERHLRGLVSQEFSQESSSSLDSRISSLRSQIGKTGAAGDGKDEDVASLRAKLSAAESELNVFRRLDIYSASLKRGMRSYSSVDTKTTTRLLKVQRSFSKHE